MKIRIPNRVKKTCGRCQGIGRVKNPFHKFDTDPGLWRNMDCPDCRASGKLWVRGR